MRLFVICRYCQGKIYINSTARNRSELPYQFSLQCIQPACSLRNQNQIFTSHDVQAEPGVAGLVSGAIVLGALAGLIAGPEGAILGGFIGALLGSSSDQAENEAVRRFNES